MVWRAQDFISKWVNPDRRIDMVVIGSLRCTVVYSLIWNLFLMNGR